METEKKLLNLGCGKRYHKDWVNVDFYSDDKTIISTNLLNGIPFPDSTFDVVYHSHILEHFPKSEALNFMKECYRVLKPGGTIRVVVPDLERIVNEYTRLMAGLKSGKKELDADYDWILLQLFDQMARNVTGGEEKKYLSQKHVPNEEYVYAQMGDSFRELRQFLFNQNYGVQPKKSIFKRKITLTKLINFVKSHVPIKEYRIGNFRLNGETHQWMYDSYSLNRLLLNAGFENTEVAQANTSRVANWNSFELDFKNGVVYKPDSLFMEATKPYKN